MGSMLNTAKLVFDRDSKACVPRYGIKNSCLGKIQPFFSPEREGAIGKRRWTTTIEESDVAAMDAAKKLGGGAKTSKPPTPEKKSALAKGKQSPKAQETGILRKAESKEVVPGLDKNNMHHASIATISEI